MKKILLFTLLILGFLSAFSQEVIFLNEKTFKEKVWDFEKDKDWKYKGDVPAVIDFYADWCGPCRMIAPELEALQKKHGKKIQVYKIDVDKHKKLARLFEIKSIPTLVYAKKGVKYKRAVGYNNKEQIEKKIGKYLDVK